MDVYVQTTEPFLRFFICECKYWKSNVTLEKVHAFRQVVQDSGAPMGILITVNGFQPGAIKAAELSNVRLNTWSDFLSTICIPWIKLKNNQIGSYVNRLLVYLDSLDVPSRLVKNIEDQYRDLIKRYIGLYDIFIELNAEDLMDDSTECVSAPDGNIYSDVESYLNCICDQMHLAVCDFEDLFKSHPIYDYTEDLKEYRYFFHYLLGVGLDEDFVPNVANSMRLAFHNL